MSAVKFLTTGQLLALPRHRDWTILVEPDLARFGYFFFSCRRRLGPSKRLCAAVQITHQGWPSVMDASAALWDRGWVNVCVERAIVGMEDGPDAWTGSKSSQTPWLPISEIVEILAAGLAGLEFRHKRLLPDAILADAEPDRMPFGCGQIVE
jgi:hypothetical protein